MDPGIGRTISYIIVFLGTALVLTGSIGTWYFGKRLEVVGPYRQPIRTVTSTVEVAIISGENINTRYMDTGSFIAFCKGKESLLVMSSTECTAKQTGKGEIIYRAIFNMDATDPAVGKPVNFLKKAAEYVQIKFLPMPEKAKVSGGKAICTFNNEVRAEITVPLQEATKGLIFVRNLETVFSEFKE